MRKIKIALVDDHELIRQSMALFIEEHGYNISFQVSSGEECIKMMSKKTPDIVLMDINMPGKGGVKATKWIASNKKKSKVIALSMLDDENSVIQMINAGARAYLVKNSNPESLFNAIEDVYRKGVHFSDIMENHVKEKLFGDKNQGNARIIFTDLEKEFLKLLCTELTFKEIADQMCVSPRTAEGWRNSLCQRLGLRGRIGLALYAIREGHAL